LSLSAFSCHNCVDVSPFLWITTTIFLYRTQLWQKRWRPTQFCHDRGPGAQKLQRHADRTRSMTSLWAKKHALEDFRIAIVMTSKSST
jgi:hypothetical protein